MLILALLGAVGLTWLYVLYRVERARGDDRWRLDLASPVAADPAALTVVIPARDEDANIGACVEAALASEHPRLSVVVFDDASSDGTAERAERAGARVIRARGHPPPGWKGKPWALERALAEVGTPWVAFVDADVRLHPGALARIQAYAERESMDLVSGYGTLAMETWGEKLLQPAVVGLVIAGNDLERANDPEHPERAMANGQLLFARRAAFVERGGWSLVRDEIVDDIQLARRLRERGARVRMLWMRSLFSCRMYRGFRETWRGWAKNLYAGVGGKPAAALGLWALLAIDFVFPYAALAAGVARGDLAVAGAAGVVVVLVQGVRWRMDRIFGQDVRWGITLPVGAVLVMALLADSVARTYLRAREWKGRRY